jgi:hypothetical protein
MPFVSATKSRVLAGTLSASCYSRGFSLSSGVDMLDVSTLCDDAKAFIPGQESSTASFTLIYDEAQAAHAGTWATAGNLPVTFLPGGAAVGDAAFLIDSIRTDYSTTTSVTGTVDASITTQTTGDTGYGVCVAALAAITTDTNGTAVDNAASSTNGGVAHLHVTAFAGLTSDVITIEHSTNNSTWATLATFTTVTAATTQRLAVTGTVNRYLRVVDDVTGTGSCTRLVAFARR